MGYYVPERRPSMTIDLGVVSESGPITPEVWAALPVLDLSLTQADTAPVCPWDHANAHVAAVIKGHARLVDEAIRHHLLVFGKPPEVIVRHGGRLLTRVLSREIK